MERIFPFLWHHGESNEVILEEIERIYECGLRAFCVESRPHPDFCGEGWWKDLGFILEEAKKRDMEVWVLDEEHYPCGRALGKYKEHPELIQENIVCSCMNTVGEIKNAKILLPYNGDEERFICALAFPLDENEKILFDGGVDLSDKVKDDVLYWDVPKGHYRVMGIYGSKNLKKGGSPFADPFRKESNQLIIDLIYQPHYEHFKEYFGSTLKGFFTDEPRLGNYERLLGSLRHNKDLGLGIHSMAYNWNDKVFSALNVTDKRVLASLWFDIDNDKCAQFRVDYMNYLTEEYGKNYSQLLGNWCSEHGVMFTGHIIEDVGAHARTSTSGGHYFKSMSGQHIAGMDVVYNQIKRNQLNYSRLTHGTPFVSNPTFYNYTIAKLAVSASRLEKIKDGRAFCELFGAFGWGESIAEMKWLIDFLLVRGINHFVPHAFNPMVDDTDSPPYFYNGGRNPQFPSFVTLMKYLKKMTEHLNGGKSIASVAVLYHADAEWSGKDYLPIDNVCRCLTTSQVEFDIIPDYEILSVDKEGVHTENCDYKLLIIPKREYVGEHLKNMLDGNDCAYAIVNNREDFDKIDIYAHSSYMLKNASEWLRVYRYEKSDCVYYMVFNEGNAQEDNFLKISENGYFEAIDEQNGINYSGKIEGGLPISLRQGQSVLYKVTKEGICVNNLKVVSEREIAPVWKYYISSYPYKEWEFYKETKDNIDVAGIDGITKFDGKILLKGKFNHNGNNALVDFGDSSLGISLRINGVDLGEKIAPPYIFDAKGSLKDGENDVEVLLTTTLGLSKRDKFTHFSAIEKYGLTKNLKVIEYTK